MGHELYQGQHGQLPGAQAPRSTNHFKKFTIDPSLYSENAVD